MVLFDCEHAGRIVRFWRSGGGRGQSGSEDMAWDVAGECLDLQGANPLNMVQVIGTV